MISFEQAAIQVEGALGDLAEKVAERYGEVPLSDLIVETDGVEPYRFDFEMFWLQNKAFFWSIPEPLVKACWTAQKLDSATPSFRSVMELVRVTV